MIYAWSTWEYLEDSQLLKLQHLQNRFLHGAGKLDRSTSIRNLHVALKILYVCDYKAKLCKTQPAVIHIHQNPNLLAIGQGEAIQRKCKGPKFGGGQAYEYSRVSVFSEIKA
jgi:hypothetical protein